MHLRFRGKALTLRVEEEGHPRPDPQPDVIEVRVDDAPARRVTLVPGMHELVLAQGLRATEHRLTVTKLTEGEAGTLRVQGLRLDDGGAILDPAPPPPRRMLVVGDSISAGYGVRGSDSTCRAVSAMCDASMAWPSLAAEALPAALHLVAWSGRGLTRNYDPTQVETLPDLATRTLPTQARPPWRGAAWPPTDILIAVGANDVARPGFDDAAYGRALFTLIARTQEPATAANVLVVVGPMLFDDAPYPGADSHRRVLAATRRVVEERRRAGFARTAWIDLAPAPPDEGLGCEQHPSARSHRRMAAEVVARLRTAPFVDPTAP